MDNVNEIISKKIILLLNEIIFILDCEGETKYFHIIDIEKTLKILEQRNYKQYELAKKKIGNATRMFNEQRFKKHDEIEKKLDEVYILINKYLLNKKVTSK